MIIQRVYSFFSHGKNLVVDSLRAFGLLFLLVGFLTSSSALWAQDSQATAKDRERAKAEAIHMISESMKRLEENVIAKKGAFSDLKGGYQTRIEKREIEILLRQFRKGREIFFAGRDYDICAEILYPIVETSVLSKTSEEYLEAEILLGSALYFSHRYIEATVYFQQILARGASDNNPHYLQALEKLLDISLKDAMQIDFIGSKVPDREQVRIKIARLQDFDRYYKMYVQYGPDDNSLKSMNYLLGKRHFFLGEYERARAYFDLVNEESPHFFKAHYFNGVIAVAEAKYREGISLFESLNRQIEALSDVPESLLELKEDALLNVARLYYEIADYESAIPYYSLIPDNAPNFSLALFELIHVYYEKNFINVQKLEDNKAIKMAIEQAFRTARRRMSESTDSDLIEAIRQEESELQLTLDSISEKEEQLQLEVENVKARAFNIYKKLQEVDPNSPFISEAEIRIGKLYLDAKDFNLAEEWYNTVTQKYKGFGKTIRDIEASPLKDGTDIFQQLLDFKQDSLSPELIAWIKKDNNVARGIKVLENISEQKELITEIITLYGEVGQDLIKLKQKEFQPIFDDTEANARKLDELVGTYRKLAGEIEQNITSQAKSLGIDQDTVVRAIARIQGIHYDLDSLQNKIQGFYQEMKDAKKQRLASLEQSLEAQKADFEGIYRKVEGWEDIVKSRTGVITLVNLKNIKKEINKLARKASMGIIDISWQKTSEKAEQIKRLQLQRNQEISEYQKQVVEEE